MPQTSVLAEPTAASIAGQIADIQPRSIRSGISEHATAIPYGIFVKKGATDDGFALPTAAGDKIIGVLAHTHVLSTLGLAAATQPIAQKDVVNVLSRGAVHVVVEEAVSPSDPVYVRFADGVADPTKTQKGSVRKSADTATAKLLFGARFLSTAGAGELAIVEFDAVAENASTLAVADNDALEADLASAAAAKGASKIGVEDSAALLTGATVEAALAELAKYQPINLADPGNGQPLPVTRSAYIGMTIAGAAETNGLALPTFLGQKLILNVDTLGGGGDRAVTASQAINQAGNTVMTFAAARDCVVLEAIKVGGAFRWQVTGNDGAALS